MLEDANTSGDFSKLIIPVMGGFLGKGIVLLKYAGIQLKEF